MRIAMISLFVVLDILLLPALIQFCFGDVVGLFKSMYYARKSNLISLLDGSWREDVEHTSNGTLFWGIVGVLGLLEVWVISGIK